MNKKRWFGVVLMMPAILAVLYVFITIIFAITTLSLYGAFNLIMVVAVVVMFIYGLVLTFPCPPDDNVVGMIKEV